MAKDIESYKIEVVEEGNSAEADWLGEEYVNTFLPSEDNESEEFDSLWNDVVSSYEWVRKTSTYTMEKGRDEAEVEISYSGLLGLTVIIRHVMYSGKLRNNNTLCVT